MAIQVLLDVPTHNALHARGIYFPIPLFEDIGLPLIPIGLFHFLQWALIASLALSALGCWTRVALVVANVSFLVYFGTVLSFWKVPGTNYVYHTQNIIPVVLSILAAAPGISIWGFDGWRRRGWQWQSGHPADRIISAWPHQLIILALALAYFGAGYCKVVNSPAWADGYTLQAYLLAKFLLVDTPSSLWLANSLWLCTILSVATLALELTFFLVLFFPRLRWIYIAGGLSFHLAIKITMQIDFFPYFCFVYLVFLDWPLVQRLGSLFHQWFVRPWTGRRLIAAPALPRGLVVGNTRAARFFVAAVSMILFGCIVSKVEYWPFSDYRVFRARNHYLSVQVLRVAGVRPDDELEWLSEDDLMYRLPELNRLMRSLVASSQIDGLQGFLDDADRRLGSKLAQRYHKLVVLRRSVERLEDGSFRPVDQVLTEWQPRGIADLRKPMPSDSIKLVGSTESADDDTAKLIPSSESVR